MIEKFNSRYFCVTKGIKQKMKLIETKLVSGVHIDRSKNLPSHYYAFEKEKFKETFKRKALQNTPVVDFE